MSAKKNPIPGSYWVRPEKLLAGEYPGASYGQTSRTRLRRLLEAGVALFIDLTQPGEYGLQSYAPLLREEALALGQAVEHKRVSIPDMGVPTQTEMKRILDIIDAVLARGQGVYVHCYAGIGRTGTVVGCYLVRHGLSGEEALAEIALLRGETPGSRQSSPQTAAQWKMVREWIVGN